MSLVTLFADTSRPSWARALAASLPASIRLVDTPGDIILIDGGDDWTGRLGHWIGRGHDRVLLVDPQVRPIDQVAPVIELAQRRGCLVMLSETHADNPAVPGFRQEISTDAAIVTITGHGSRPVTQLALEQVRLARAAGFERPALDHAIASDDGLLATLTVDRPVSSVTLRLCISRCDAGWEHHRLTTHALTASDIIRVHGGTTARPATATHVRPDGLRERPTIYESAHRARLRQLIDHPSMASAELEGWMDDARLAIVMGESRRHG